MTVKGVNKTKIDSATPENRLEAGEFDGRQKVITDLYEAVALDIGDIIQLGGRIPKNAIVNEILLSCDALGGSSTLDIGDAEDTTRYFSAQDSSSELINQQMDEIDGVNYKVDETDSDNLDSQIQAIVGGAAITGTIKVTIKYSHA